MPALFARITSGHYKHPEEDHKQTAKRAVDTLSSLSSDKNRGLDPYQKEVLRLIREGATMKEAMDQARHLKEK